MVEKVKTTNYFDGYKLGKHQIFFLVIVGLTYAFDFLDQGLFAVCSPVLVAQYGLTNETIASLSFLLLFGSFCGAAAGGIMSDKLGRKNSLLISIVIFTGASLASALWQPHYVFMLEATRFLTGFGTLSALTVAMAYISEMLPSESRGKYQSIVLGIGTFTMPFLSIGASRIVMLGANAWRFIFLIGAAMLILVPFAVQFLEESPRYLISKGRVAEAEQVMSRCLGFACDMSEAYENYERSRAQYQKISFPAQMKILFSKGQAKQTIICLLFCICLGSGNVMMSQYQNVFLVEMGMPMASVLLAGAVASFGQPIGELSSSLVSDRGGRIVPIFGYCILAGILCVALGFVKTPFMYGVLQLLKMIFAAGGMALMMTYVPESFPTSVRGSATGYVFGIQRLFIAGTTFIVMACYNAGGWLYCMIANSAFWFLAGFIVLLFGKRTAKQALDTMTEQAK